MWKNWTSFQKWIVFLLVSALLIDFGIIIALSSTLRLAKNRLGILGDTMEQTAQQHIKREIPLSFNLPLNSNIEVSDEIIVGIDMVVQSEYRFLPVSRWMKA